MKKTKSSYAFLSSLLHFPPTEHAKVPLSTKVIIQHTQVLKNQQPYRSVLDFKLQPSSGQAHKKRKSIAPNMQSNLHKDTELNMHLLTKLHLLPPFKLNWSPFLLSSSSLCKLFYGTPACRKLIKIDGETANLMGYIIHVYYRKIVLQLFCFITNRHQKIPLLSN